MDRHLRTIKTATPADCLDYVARVTAVRLLHPAFCRVRRCRRVLFCTGAPVKGAGPIATSAMFGAPTDLYAPVCFAQDVGLTGAAFCALLEETVSVFEGRGTGEAS